jgi:hypothetical protein
MSNNTPYPRINPTAVNGNIDTIREEVLNWFATGNTGMSSKAIALNIAGIETEHHPTPSDPSDFRRCIDMVKACPSIQNLTPLVENAPHYAPFTREWNNMIDLYETEFKEDTGRAPLLYKFMKRLCTESLFILGRVVFRCRHMDIADFEEITGVTPTLDNLYQLSELGEAGIKQKHQQENA